MVFRTCFQPRFRAPPSERRRISETDRPKDPESGRMSRISARETQISEIPVPVCKGGRKRGPRAGPERQNAVLKKRGESRFLNRCKPCEV